MNGPKIKLPLGFTLLEVMVSIAILSLSIISIMRLFGISLNSVQMSKDHTYAALLAKSKMDDILLNMEKFQPSSESGTFDQFGGKYNYQVEITEFTLPNLPSPEKLNFHQTTSSPEEELIKTYKITVTVFWEGKKVMLETLRTAYQKTEL